jgi:chromosome segregation ATPase
MSDWEINWRAVAQEAEKVRDLALEAQQAATLARVKAEQERDQARQWAQMWKAAAKKRYYPERFLDDPYDALDLAAAAEERAANLAVELAAMTLSRDQARQEIANLQRRAEHAAQELDDALDAVGLVTKDRDEARQEAANLEYSNNAHRETAETWRGAAAERDTLRKERDQARQEADLLRRQVDALASIAARSSRCEDCGLLGYCETYGSGSCSERLRAWAAQQAKEGGK